MGLVWLHLGLILETMKILSLVWAKNELYSAMAIACFRNFLETCDLKKIGSAFVAVNHIVQRLLTQSLYFVDFCSVFVKTSKSPL